MQANIFDIHRASMVDGPGVRTAIFFKGCNLRCAWCHDPEGMEVKRQLLFYENRCTHCGRCKDFCAREVCVSCGECQNVCLSCARKSVGRSISPDELLSIVRSIDARCNFLWKTMGIIVSANCGRIEKIYWDAVLM